MCAYVIASGLQTIACNQILMFQNVALEVEALVISLIFLTTHTNVSFMNRRVRGKKGQQMDMLGGWMGEGPGGGWSCYAWSKDCDKVG